MVGAPVVMTETLTQGRLKEVLSYDPDVGVFIRVAPLKGQKVGSRSGVRSACGYMQVGVDRQTYLGHRLAWFYVHGVWPNGQIDHLNGDRADNRISNLRDVSGGINQQNQRKPHIDATSGFLGVRRSRNRWRAAIKNNGRILSLGTYDTPKLAHEAYLGAKRKMHEGCTI